MDWSAFQVYSPQHHILKTNYTFHTATETLRKRPRTNRSKWTCALPKKLQSLATDLALQQDSKSRYLKLASYGETFTSIQEDELKNETRVHGCTSITHVEVIIDNTDHVFLRGYSDAKISRGIVGLFVQGLNGSTCNEIEQINIEQILKASQLKESVSSTRINGLTNILWTIQNRIREIKSNISSMIEKKKDRSEIRWTDPQGEDVAVLLSGGVDSSVAMRLAQESGARVHPFYLKIWLDDELKHLGECPWEEDIKYANAVCEQIGVKLQDVAFQNDYWDEVVTYTINEAKKGRTPNPDVMCNSRIKFGAFLKRIGKDYDRIISGHYARTNICEEDSKTELLLSKDMEKDQTYFLSHLSQQQLNCVSFPIGEYTKKQVRQLALNYNLPNKTRKDSQGICFLGKLKFDEFLAHHLGYEKGQLVEYESGKQLGYHRGFWFFTLGQRKGIGLSNGPWYVVAKDVDRNIVYVSNNYYGIEMERNCFDFEDVLWISEDWPKDLSLVGTSRRMRVKTRHGPRFHNAIVTRLENGKGRVELEERDKGLAPGQFAAFYDDADRCLGSAIITLDTSLSPPSGIVIPMNQQSAKLQAHF